MPHRVIAPAFFHGQATVATCLGCWAKEFVISEFVTTAMDLERARRNFGIVLHGGLSKLDVRANGRFLLSPRPGG